MSQRTTQVCLFATQLKGCQRNRTTEKAPLRTHVSFDGFLMGGNIVPVSVSINVLHESAELAVFNVGTWVIVETSNAL